MAKRVSITKAERQSAVAVELLALCQNITADGTISLEEIKALVRWLNDHRNDDLPAIEFLASTVRKIIADRKVTPEEQEELYHAVETILPPDLRKEAVRARKEFEAELKYREKLEKEAARKRERAEWEKRHPLASFDFIVAGVLYENRGAIISRYAKKGDRVFLARDPGNPYSPHAVEVRLGNGFQIGFVPEEHARDLAPYLDSGLPHWACLKKILPGTRGPIPVVLAYVYRMDSDVDGIVFPNQVPPKVTPPRIGCLLTLGLFSVPGPLYLLLCGG